MILDGEEMYIWRLIFINILKEVTYERPAFTNPDWLLGRYLELDGVNYLLRRKGSISGLKADSTKMVAAK